MNFFKKLFAKQKSVDDQVRDIIKNFDLKIEVTSSSYTKTAQEINDEEEEEKRRKGYNISDIKKQAAQIQKDKGYLDAVNFLKNFIENKNIESDEMIRLLKVIVEYSLEEESINEIQILEYINLQINEFSIQEDPKKQLEFYKITNKVNHSVAVKYLEDVTQDRDIDVNKSPEFIDLFIELSDIYLKEKQSDKAFQTLQRANNLTPKIQDSFYYMWKLAKIEEKQAEICLKGCKR